MNHITLLDAEPRLARLFVNSRKKDRLANAYLLFGNSNAPLKETAMYLAKSLWCEEDLLACDNCDSCLRFNKGIRPDFYLIDGNNTTIKKEDIKALEDSFSLSSFEKNHRLVYVINQIQNITPEAANALLKFLEEPREGQVAFLTASNIERVLPTIRSRCLEVRVDPLSDKEFEEDITGLEFTYGKEVKTISAPEAYILSKYYSNIDEVKDTLEDNSSFFEGFAAAESFLYELVVNKKKASYLLLKATYQLKDSQCYNWMYRTLNVIFTNALLLEKNDCPFSDVIKELSLHTTAISDLVDVIREAISLKQLNLSPLLIVAKLIKIIDEEY